MFAYFLFIHFYFFLSPDFISPDLWHRLRILAVFISSFYFCHGGRRLPLPLPLPRPRPRLFLSLAPSTLSRRGCPLCLLAPAVSPHLSANELSRSLSVSAESKHLPSPLLHILLFPLCLLWLLLFKENNRKNTFSDSLVPH